MTVPLPLRHVSIRVPWHDNGWNGSVCHDPAGNAACLVLKEVRDNRDDAREVALAGASIDDLDQTTQWPACMGERGAIMAPFEHTRIVKHPYASFSAEHAHMKPVPFRHPEYSAATIPFRWMSRDGAWQLGEEYDLDVDPAREPMDGWLEHNNWVQDHDNQRALLDAFFGAIEPERSLCFFYVKQSPMVDDADRVLVGAGRVLSIGEPIEYAYTSLGGFRSYVWDRAIQHSIRPEYSDGFLLPYHELLTRAHQDPTVDLRACTAIAPPDRRGEFSYAGEHVTHDGAIAALLSCREALENAEPFVETSTGPMLRWIDERLGELWRLRGPYPGLGAALIAFGVEHGNFLALELSDKLAENEDPMPMVDRVMDDPALLSERGQSYLSRTNRDKWRAIGERRPERRRLFELIARLELTPAQATRLYVVEEREEIWPELRDADLLANPYLVFEKDRVNQEPVSAWTVDRGVFPAPAVRETHPLPNLHVSTTRPIRGAFGR